MSCVSLTQIFPNNPSITDYDAFIRTQASNQGLICVQANYATNCQNQCTNVSQNTSACTSCLSSVNSCTNPANPSQSCCPYAAQAIQCNNCLNSFTIDALQHCLQPSGLSAGAIAGIVIAVIVVIIGLGLLIYYLYARDKQRLVKKLSATGRYNVKDLELANLSELQNLSE